MSVDAMIRKPQFPFSRFLQDREEYKLSQDFWQRSFEEGLKHDFDPQDWVGWMDNPFMDGMPVWSAINRKIWRGISVQQVGRSDDQVWFKCWISKSRIESSKLLPYLFVETFISKSSYEIFAKLINSWADDGIKLANISLSVDSIQQSLISRMPLTAED